MTRVKLDESVTATVIVIGIKMRNTFISENLHSSIFILGLSLAENILEFLFVKMGVNGMRLDLESEVFLCCELNLYDTGFISY